MYMYMCMSLSTYMSHVQLHFLCCVLHIDHNTRTVCCATVQYSIRKTLTLHSELLTTSAEQEMKWPRTGGERAQRHQKLIGNTCTYTCALTCTCTCTCSVRHGSYMHATCNGYMLHVCVHVCRCHRSSQTNVTVHEH